MWGAFFLFFLLFLWEAGKPNEVSFMKNEKN